MAALLVAVIATGAAAAYARSPAAGFSLSNVTCRWVDGRVLMSGTAHNTGSGGTNLEIRPFYRLARLGWRGSQVQPLFLHLDGGQVKHWSATPVSKHGHPVGTPITSCSPDVSVVPPPNPDD